MGHLIKYRLLQFLREKSTMFWSLAFPLILSTFFYFSFGEHAYDDAFAEIPVALAETGKAADDSFSRVIGSLDGSLLSVRQTDEKEALRLLEEGKVEGVFYDTEKLVVGASGTRASILGSVLTSYQEQAGILADIGREHPERLEQAAVSLLRQDDLMEEGAAGGQSLDLSLSFFFAAIAMAAMYGCFPGLQSVAETRANLSALGARQCISPVHRMKRILAGSLVTYAAEFLNVVIVLCYIRYVLGVDLGGSMAGMLVICLLGSMTGVSLGVIVGCGSRKSQELKTGILIGVSMVSCFLGGLMSPDIRTMTEEYFPLLNHVNPATLISNAMYCLNVYHDRGHLIQNLGTLGVMSAVLVILAFLLVRRERYESL